MFLTVLLFSCISQAPTPATYPESLTEEEISIFTKTAMESIVQEVPWTEFKTYLGEESVVTPKELHPTFYGCFDWHSAVHNHWMLVRILKTHPGFEGEQVVRDFLHKQFSKENLRTEAAYFENLKHSDFEEPYGWAWVLLLALELRTWENDVDAKIWAAHLHPLEKQIVNLFSGFVPLIPAPERHGMHENTAFAFSLAWDYAHALHLTNLEKSISKRAQDFFLKDVNYPSLYEPSGKDFLSPGFAEADLMRRVLSQNDFQSWLTSFFPNLENGRLGNMLTPTLQSGAMQGAYMHHIGLNFSRSWAMEGIVLALPNEDSRIDILLNAASLHREAAMDFVTTGVYDGDHWLPTFAVYLLTSRGLE